MSGLNRARGATGQFDSDLRGRSRAWSTLGSVLAKVGIGIGLSFAVGLAAAISAASGFQTQMSAVQAVSGATAAELGAVRQAALDLGASTIYSATEVGGAMEELVKAGLTVEQVLGGAADATVAMAAASGIDLADAATIGANALNTFKLQASDLPGVADTLAGAANTSAIGVGDLALSLQQSGAAANLAGLSLEDTVTAIGLMGDAGIRGSDAGTSLKTMLMNLQPATAKQRTEMERLGLVTEDGVSAFFDARGEVKSLADIAGILQYSLGGLTRAQQLMSLEVIFGSDAIRAAAVLMSEGASGAEEFATAMGKLSAEDIAKMRLDNLSGDIEAFQGAVDTFLISSGTPLVEWLRDVVQFGTGGIEWLNNPPKGLVEWGSNLADVLQLSAQLIPSGGDHTQLLARLEDGYGGLGDAAAGVVPILGDIWSTGENLLDLAAGLANDLRPAAEGLAKLGAGGIAVGLRTTASVLEGVTGLIADHSDVVLAAAVSYGLWRASIIGGAIWASVSAGLGVVTAAYASYQAAMLTAVGVNRAQQIEMSRTRILMGLTATSAKNLATSTAFLSTVSFVGLGVAVTAIYMGMQRAEEQAKAWRSSVEDEIDPRSVSSITDAQDIALEKYEAMQKAGEIMGVVNASAAEKAGAAWRGGIEMLTPLENKTADAAEAAREAADAYNDWGRQATELKTKFWEVGEALDLPALHRTSIVENWVQALDLDPATMSANELADAIDEGRRASETGAPAVDTLTEAFTVLDTETSSATDKLDAFKEAMDALAGVNISYEQALIGFTGSINELTDAQIAGWVAGEEWSTNLQGTDAAALRTRETVAGLADEAIGLATSYYEAGGGIDGATWSLMSNRQAIIDAGVAAGISEEDMRTYLDTLGLTPENITTVIAAQTDEESLSAADEALDVVSRNRESTTFADAITGGAEGHLAHLARDRTARIDVDFDVRGQGVVIGGGVTLANTGGRIYGPNVDRDVVPAMLTPDEHVITQKKARLWGHDFFDAINSGRIMPSDFMAMAHGQLAGFNGGGAVDISGDWGSGTLNTWGLGRVGPEILAKAKDEATAWMDRNFAEAYSTMAPAGGGGANAAQARAWIIQALGILGLPMSWLEPAMRRANQESGYNPHAINLWDSNARKGVPSKGLFQTIDPTFSAYRLPGMTDIWNPIHNAVAAFRYMISRYGSVFNLPSGGYNLGGHVEGPGYRASDVFVHANPWDAAGALHAAPPGLNAFWNGTGRTELFQERTQPASPHMTASDRQAVNVNVSVQPVMNVKVFVGDREITDIARVEAEGVLVQAYEAEEQMVRAGQRHG